jgi:hypothetical protein
MANLNENYISPDNKINNLNELFIKDSEDTDEDQKINITFSSSDSEEAILNKNTNATNSSNFVNPLKKNATNGINFVNEISDKSGNVSENDLSQLNYSSHSDTKPPDTKPPDDHSEHKNMTNMMENMLKPNNVNGWDEEANITLRNWYHTFKQQSYIYQWVLDNNNYMSEKLALASIVTSSVLGIFAGFKLWIPSDVFQTSSNIILILSNFGVALITSMSRRYGDDKRTDSIRNYVSEVDEFLGKISAQVLKSPIYRMNADEFFKENNDKYTKLIMGAPNMSLEEIAKAKKLYKSYSQEIEIPV